MQGLRGVRPESIIPMFLGLNVSTSVSMESYLSWTSVKIPPSLLTKIELHVIHGRAIRCQRACSALSSATAIGFSDKEPPTCWSLSGRFPFSCLTIQSKGYLRASTTGPTGIQLLHLHTSSLVSNTRHTQKWHLKLAPRADHPASMPNAVRSFLILHAWRLACNLGVRPECQSWQTSRVWLEDARGCRMQA